MIGSHKPNHVSLAAMIAWLRAGRFVIPDFQRTFEWQPWDICDLMRSIFRDYFIGNLLLLGGKKENFDALSCEPVYGFNGTTEDPSHIVLDGQQRLTAMHYAFMAPDTPLPRRHNRYLFFIRVDRYMEEEYGEAFTYDWSQYGKRLLGNKTLQFEEHMFPLAIVGTFGADFTLANWLQGYAEHWKSKADTTGEEDHVVHAEHARMFGKVMAEIIPQYEISYTELDQNLPIDKVCDIFTKLNNTGIRLDIFDLVNALVKPKGVQLKHLWREAESRLNSFKAGHMKIYVLQVMSILRQAYCSPKYLYYLIPGQGKKVRGQGGATYTQVLVQDAETFTRLWGKSVSALERASQRLIDTDPVQGFGAGSSYYLPYVSMLPPFAAIQAAVDELEPPQQLDARLKVRDWYWASVFTNRYSSAVESTSARDYQALTTWFGNDNAKPAFITDFQRNFLNLDLRWENRRGTATYNGIFSILMLNGAHDWITGDLPAHGLFDHHIVPKSWGKGQNLVTSIDNILNRTPLTEKTYKSFIGDRLPNAYLPELMRSVGEDRVRVTLESHLVSDQAFNILLRKDFGPDTFEEFLSERKRSVMAAIRDVGYIHLLPETRVRLRKLDSEVTAVELGLRVLIADRLGNDPTRLPARILQKINDRTPQPSSTLAGLLEYSDLQDLKEVILSKHRWEGSDGKSLKELFQDNFGKDQALLDARFNHFVKLRNAIRHVRTADEITLKDGEAAILWLQKVLGVTAEVYAGT